MLKWLKSKRSSAESGNLYLRLLLDLSTDAFVFCCSSDEKPAVTIMRSEITEILAFKRDLFSVDTICIRISCGDGKGIEIWEEDACYKMLVAAIENLYPQCPNYWWQKVAFPAFVPNETVLYRNSDA